MSEITQGQNCKYAFFGSSRFSVIVLDELKKFGLIPSLIITTPDKPKGRKLILTPTPVKEWAVKNGIEFFDQAKLDSAFVEKLSKKVSELKIQVFVVASYGKIIPESIINLPERSTLNIHPSLLPKYRGASPLQSAILDDTKNTGVSIMQIDKEMDHGALVAQKEIAVNEWPTYEEFENLMAVEGAVLLMSVLVNWIQEKIEAKAQDHSKATFTKKISKENALLDLSSDPYLNFRKIQAFHEWPKAYFVHKYNGKEIKVKITDADYKNGKLLINKVIPEAGREMSLKDFENGFGKVYL